MKKERPEIKKEGERIAKVMARAGLCSRREAERWIEEGRVSVNGETLSSPALSVTDKDRILVDNAPLPTKEKTRLFLYHKPAGVVTTHKDEKGRKTLFEQLPEGLPRLISIGRLDLNTEGLILLTNDGELARYLELPSTGWVRKYRVRVHGKPEPKKLASLKQGVTVEGVRYGPIDAVIEHEGPSNAWLSVSLSEGKKREVRRVLEHTGLTVNRLIRISYGPFQLGKLERGRIKEFPQKALKEQISGFYKT